MWFIPSKKDVKKGFKSISNKFKRRDILTRELKTDVEQNKVKIARLEGMIQIMMINKQTEKVTKSQKVSISPNKSHNKIETKVVSKVKRGKKALTMAYMSKLAPSHSTIEMFEKVVLEKGMCSKATFYRYISSLKSQKDIKTETTLRLHEAQDTNAE